MVFSHTSVLLKEAVDYLVTDPGGIYVDGTLGGGGHSYEICRRLTKDGRLIGIDQDGDAIRAAAARLEPFADKVTIIRSNYRAMKAELKAVHIRQADGILLDLGVSSFQLDEPERGFAYAQDGAPLDMRMDRRQSLTAREILDTYSEQELYRILRDYGEERFAKNIAKQIVRARANGPIETAGDLNAIIEKAIPPKVRASGGHPSKRTFQALRIEVNAELTVLREAMDDMVSLLSPGGRLAIITFHSLEDRIVKNAFRTMENPCICPPDFPVCTCGRVPKGKVLTKKPVLPSLEEMNNNKRAKSAKLRVFEKKESTLS